MMVVYATVKALMQLISSSPRHSGPTLGRFIWPILAFGVGALVMGLWRHPTTPTGAVTNTEGAAVVKEPNKIVINALDGGVEYKKGDAWVALTNKTELAAGEQIRIVGKGTADLTLQDAGLVRLGSDTEITLKQVNDQAVVINLARGQLFSRTLVTDRDWQVVTAGATYSTKSTAMLNYLDDTTDSVAVFMGSAEIKADKLDATTVKAGQQFYVATPDVKAFQALVPISDITLQTDAFINWNATRDRELKLSETDLGVLNNTQKKADSSIELSANTTDQGVVLTWKIVGTLDTSRGFKVVKSADKNPAYPGGSYQSENGNIRTHTWEIKDGQTYHFRVCQYQADGTCGVYSNDVAVVAPAS